MSDPEWGEGKPDAGCIFWTLLIFILGFAAAARFLWVVWKTAIQP